jgi:hypothetical protein
MKQHKVEEKVLTEIIKHLVVAFGCLVVAWITFDHLDALVILNPEYLLPAREIKVAVFLLLIAAMTFSIYKFNSKVPIWPYEEIASVNDKKWPAVRFSPRCYGCKAQKENGIEYCLRCSGFNAEDHY